MRAVLNIALQHVRNTLNGRGAIISTFLVPIIMVVFLGSALGSSTAPTGQIFDISRANDPTDNLAAQLVEQLRIEGRKLVAGNARFIICDLSQPTNQPEQCKLSPNASGDVTLQVKQRMDSNITNGAIMIPAQFGISLRKGTNVTISVNAKGGPTAAQAMQQVVAAAATRVSGSITAARVVTEKASGDSVFFDKVYSVADSVWANDPIQIDESYSTVTGTEAGSGFGQSAPGIGAMFVLMTALLLADVFIEERNHGTLQRLMILPLHKTQVLAGKLLGQYLVAVIVFSVMIAVGILFGVRWGDPLGVIVIVLVYTFAVTALGLLLSTLAKTLGQANGIRLLVALILAPLGGAWWPLSIVPPAMREIGKVSPIYWSQDAFTNMIFYGARLQDILPHVAILLVFGVVVFAIGASRFRYE